MGKAIASTSEDVQKEQGNSVREERVAGGWDRFEADEKRVNTVKNIILN